MSACILICVCVRVWIRHKRKWVIHGQCAKRRNSTTNVKKRATTSVRTHSCTHNHKQLRDKCAIYRVSRFRYLFYYNLLREIKSTFIRCVYCTLFARRIFASLRVFLFFPLYFFVLFKWVWIKPRCVATATCYYVVLSLSLSSIIDRITIRSKTCPTKTSEWEIQIFHYEISFHSNVLDSGRAQLVNSISSPMSDLRCCLSRFSSVSMRKYGSRSVHALFLFQSWFYCTAIIVRTHLLWN